MPQDNETLNVREVTAGTIAWNEYKEGQLAAEHLSIVNLPRIQIRARDLDLEEIAAALAPFIQLDCDCICGSSDS